MRGTICTLATFLLTLISCSCVAATSVEKVHNDKVIVLEETLQPAESEAQAPAMPSMMVYMSGDKIAHAGSSATASLIHPGLTVFEQPSAGRLQNVGTQPLHFARIVFLTPGADQTWGVSGLSPHYVLLLENRYARAYDIKIPAHTREPQHTHHDRVVVSLSGAQLEHILPSGQIQPSTLKTGEIVWRLGGTHIGHNLGDTDLWVIAVEPK